jgi:hypothetical protein
MDLLLRNFNSSHTRMGKQFCQRYFRQLLAYNSLKNLLAFNPGLTVKALGLTRNSALYFNCLLFSRFGDNIFIPLSTRLLAVPILCQVEVEVSPMLRPGLATLHPRTFPSTSLRRVGKSDSLLSSERASTRCFSHQHFLLRNSVLFSLHQNLC